MPQATRLASDKEQFQAPLHQLQNLCSSPFYPALNSSVPPGSRHGVGGAGGREATGGSGTPWTRTWEETAWSSRAQSLEHNGSGFKC